MKTLFPHPRSLVLFLLLNALDLLLTWQLLEPGAPQSCERNPIADWWLRSCGWAGLVGFKAAMVLFAAALFVVVAWRRPTLGKWALNLGSVLVAGVVLYSGLLLHRNYADLAAVRQARARDADLERSMAHCREWVAFQQRLDEELSAGRCSLAEAAERLARSERARDPVWRRALRAQFPGATEEERLAAFLIHHAVTSLSREPERARRLAVRLGAEYRAKFGGPFAFSPDQLLASPRWARAEDDEGDLAPPLPRHVGGGLRARTLRAWGPGRPPGRVLPGRQQTP